LNGRLQAYSRLGPPATELNLAERTAFEHQARTYIRSPPLNHSGRDHAVQGCFKIFVSRREVGFPPNCSCAGGSVERTDSTFLANNGSLGHPRVPTRVYTAGLHRPNPVAQEKPCFIGFFASQASLAEREGHSATFGTIRLLSEKSSKSGPLEGYIADYKVDYIS